VAEPPESCSEEGGSRETEGLTVEPAGGESRDTQGADELPVSDRQLNITHLSYMTQVNTTVD